MIEVRRGLRCWEPIIAFPARVDNDAADLAITVSPARRLLRSPTHPPVRLGGGSLGRAPRRAANPAQPRRHPSPRPQKSLQQTRQIKVRIQLGKVYAQARRT